MDRLGVIFLFVVVILSYVTLKFIIFQRARREAGLLDRLQGESVTTENRLSQTYIISPVYTIEANREPLSYEAALSMPRTTRSIEITNKSYDDDLPSYDQAIVNSKSTGIVNVAAVTVPIPVSNADVR